MRREPIYVETTIKSDLDTLWKYSQAPDLYERWDLRFTGITYLPQASEDEPQRFIYETRIDLPSSV